MAYSKILVALLPLVVFPASAHAGKDVTFESLPAPVKATVTREVGSGYIVEIEQETKRGRLVFEIEYVDDRGKWELDVAPDGTLLQRRED